MIVEVFKTNVQSEIETNNIINSIQNQFPECQINFDLEDCDKILRVAGFDIKSTKIIELINRLGYFCVALD